ncbi:hypothetical protein OIV83_005573 [Microbotryomycetes sp. JL201]|nr:hypothetical protein OIV83_005573 [Microbotryomycetes sp. JL201]
MRRVGWLLAVVALSSVIDAVAAHAHHDEDMGPYEDNFLNDEASLAPNTGPALVSLPARLGLSSQLGPIDATLKWHIGIQALCWGLIFPAGMVLGITKHRLHVPLQTLGVLLSLFVGNSLGHHHGGRSFHSTAHMYASRYMWWYLVLQTGFGVFLKLHVCEGTKLRRGFVVAHGIVGKSFPVVGWAQMVLGGIASLGFCFNDHFGQCLAHFLMGSAFIAYAFILLVMLRLGAGWLARRRCSQEFLDSWVIMVWGIINTFTEHDFLSTSNHWSHKDMASQVAMANPNVDSSSYHLQQQHVSLGVLWWAGGALGIFLGRNGKRNVVPGVIMTMTGYAMSAHEQSTAFSTTVHKLFGVCLMSAGVTRVIEICFVLKDSPSPAEQSLIRSFQHLPPYLLVLSGLTFMSATEEQVKWVDGEIGMDATTYANILFSGAFIVYLVGIALVELYERQARAKQERDDARERGDVEDQGRHTSLQEEFRSWFGLKLDSFPGRGRTVGRMDGATVASNSGLEMSDRHYETVPSSLAGAAAAANARFQPSQAQPSGRPELDDDRRVFELGEEGDDDGGDHFWDEDEGTSVGSSGNSSSSRLRTESNPARI